MKHKAFFPSFLLLSNDICGFFSIIYTFRDFIKNVMGEGDHFSAVRVTFALMALSFCYKIDYGFSVWTPIWVNSTSFFSGIYWFSKKRMIMTLPLKLVTSQTIM